jgi:hypothetical protein
MAKKTQGTAVKITRQRLTDALVWNCPRYTRNGFASCCDNLDGTYSNCVKDQCSQVFDIFKTMAKIAAGEIEVF